MEAMEAGGEGRLPFCQIYEYIQIGEYSEGLECDKLALRIMDEFIQVQ